MNLQERMKRYESSYDFTLPINMPIVIRLDGWHFKSFTKGLKKPFDLIFRETMVETMKELCKVIPDIQFAYTQSDEISFIIINFDKLEKTPWFDNRINKLISISSSIASVKFNEILKRKVKEEYDARLNSNDCRDKDLEEYKIYEKKFGQAYFDARAYVIPKEDIINYLYWREWDGIRNSVQSVGYTYFSQKELLNKNTNDIIELLKGKGINWYDYPLWLQRGVVLFKDLLGKWSEDRNIPIFKKDGRSYVRERIPILAPYSYLCYRYDECGVHLSIDDHIYNNKSAAEARRLNLLEDDPDWDIKELEKGD